GPRSEYGQQKDESYAMKFPEHAVHDVGCFSIKAIPNAEEAPGSLIWAEHVRRVEGEPIRVLGRDDRLAVAVKLHELVGWVVRPGDDERIPAGGCPIQQVLDTAVDLYAVSESLAQLDVLDAPPR